MNAWVLWVFVLPQASNFIMETIYLLSKLDLLCQYEMIFWHYIVTKSSIIDDLGSEIHLWLVYFLYKVSPKGLNFSGVDI